MTHDSKNCQIKGCGACDKTASKILNTKMNDFESRVKEEFLKFIEDNKIPWGQNAKTESIIIADWFLSTLRQEHDRAYREVEQKLRNILDGIANGSQKVVDGKTIDQLFALIITDLSTAIEGDLTIKK